MDQVGVEGAGSKVFIKEVLHKASFLYSEDGFITYLNLDFPQRELNVLMSLFNWAGL